ncbi:hypothetical protein BD289DRAFT_110253 [Coniella lustricola]|uniref:Uncharacterized protein n=1 Tax=Coniella lustricola TaxID=2025994 RepID=A0A2T2ZXF9_9PEZI|nr:hypothetical protein BD289DRAFT_110253 [Coniella lustricola]
MSLAHSTLTIQHSSQQLQHVQHAAPTQLLSADVDGSIPSIVSLIARILRSSRQAVERLRAVLAQPVALHCQTRTLDILSQISQSCRLHCSLGPARSVPPGRLWHHCHRHRHHRQHHQHQHHHPRRRHSPPDFQIPDMTDPNINGSSCAIYLALTSALTSEAPTSTQAHGLPLLHPTHYGNMDSPRAMPAVCPATSSFPELCQLSCPCTVSRSCSSIDHSIPTASRWAFYC